MGHRGGVQEWRADSTCWDKKVGTAFREVPGPSCPSPAPTTTLPLPPWCPTQVSYAIGVPEPLSVFVDSYGTGTIPDSKILAKGTLRLPPL